jgi:hypothetical protein
MTMRKQSIFVHGYQRRPFYLQGSYVSEPKRTIEHFRAILVDTEKDIKAGIEAEKKSRKKLEDELEQTRKRSQVELEKAIEEQNQAKIRQYKRQQQLLAAEAEKLKVETAKVAQYQSLRDEMAKHLYARGSPLSQEMAKLKRKKELESAKNEIMRGRIETKQQFENLLQTRANTIATLKRVQQADTTQQMEAARQRLEAAREHKVSVPSPTKALEQITGAAAARESRTRLETLAAKEKGEKTDLSLLPAGRIMGMVAASRITLTPASREFAERSKVKSIKRTRVNEAGRKSTYSIYKYKGQEYSTAIWHNVMLPAASIQIGRASCRERV